MACSDGKLFAVGRMDAVEGTGSRVTRKDDLDALRVKHIVELGDSFVTRLAQVSVAKTEPFGNRTTVSALESHALNSMISTSSAAVTQKLFRRCLIEGLSSSAVSFASIVKTATLGTSKQVDPVKDLLPVPLTVFDLQGHNRRWFLLPHILYHLVLFHHFLWLLWDLLHV